MVLVTLTVVLMPSGHVGFGRMLIVIVQFWGWGLNCKLAEFNCKLAELK